LSLDSARKLPVDRRDHWAYCRAYDVVRRINARPASAREWAAIDAEIETIRALSPTNWFAEYLHNRAKERNPGNRPAKTQRSGKIVVRGASPEEPPPGTAAPAGPPPVQAPVPQPALLPPQGSAVKWGASPVVTANFQVVYPEGQKVLAEQVARGAEDARGGGFKRWGDPNKGLGWTPRCEVVIFPTAADLCRETDQPADSPGFSTMGMNDGKIVFRRVHVRADHPNMIKAILPHEVTHVVLADLFPTQQIPRWADEGMAVLMEPAAEQHVRAADLEAPLAAGRLFRMGDLMTMDYPSPQDLPLYYAQSVSLTRFLVDQGTPTQFVAFVREAQRAGFEPALKSVYKLKGYDELQGRWVAYAKATPTSELAASSGSKATTDAAGRR
jgi:hypothetical protein